MKIYLANNFHKIDFSWQIIWATISIRILVSWFAEVQEARGCAVDLFTFAPRTSPTGGHTAYSVSHSAVHTPHPPHPHPNPTTPPPSSYPFTQGKPNTHTVCCTSTPVYKLHTAHCTYNTSLYFKSINQESTKRTNPILHLEPPSETPYFTLCRESATYVSGLVHN